VPGSNRLRITLNRIPSIPPDDWDQLYLGFQPWRTEVDVPTIESEHIWRIFNANRTHALSWNKRGYQKFIRHLTDLTNKPEGNHIDHWLGDLHEQLDVNGEHIVNVYASRPQLVMQGESKSDITGNNNYTKLWKVEREKKASKKMKQFAIIKGYRVGYGDIGLNGELGYEGRRVDGQKFGYQYISAHAPSTVTIEVEKPIEITAILNSTGGPHRAIESYIDGVKISEVDRNTRELKPIELGIGQHVLEFKTDDNRSSHSVWGIKEVPIDVIEILCNCRCGRRCPGCNQSPFMNDQPDYEYTAEDAQALVSKLEQAGEYRSVCFTGGEPMLWKCRKEVADVFKASPNIIEMWVVTSNADEASINELKGLFGKVCLSKRMNTAELIDSKPAYLSDVTIWNQTEHAIPGTAPPADKVNCCCKGQGIRASIIGQTVYPCVLAKSMELAGDWDKAPTLTLDEYIVNGFDVEIGGYEACKKCLNNLYYRSVCKKEKTGTQVVNIEPTPATIPEPITETITKDEEPK